MRRRSLTRPPLSPTQRLRRPCSRMRAAVGEHGAPNARRASAPRAHARAANLPTAQHSSAKRNPATGGDYRWSRGKLQDLRPPSLGRGNKNPMTGVDRQPQGKSPRGNRAPGGIRTPNLLIRSQMLYPLSYGRLETSTKCFTPAQSQRTTTGAPHAPQHCPQLLAPEPHHK